VFLFYVALGLYFQSAGLNVSMKIDVDILANGRDLERFKFIILKSNNSAFI